MITVKSGIDNYITVDSVLYSCFAGNNYLGLANHPVIVESVIDSLRKYGVNFSASRQTTGTSDIHMELERLLADFNKQEDAVVFASGYMGNKILMETLNDHYSLILADSFAHPSILDGMPKGTPFCLYDHCNPDHLERLLKVNKKHRSLIITDGIFALTGEIAPLDLIYPLAEKYNALMIVDDAHAMGVLGNNGRGTPEYFNIDGLANLYQTGTMSKALGAYGGFIVAGKELIDKIRANSAFYGASTSLPPPVVAAGCAAVRFLTQHPELREKVIGNARLIRTGICELGYATTNTPAPIIPLLFREKQEAMDLSEFLERNHIIAPAVEYPVKINTYIVRITVSSNHTESQIANFLNVLKKWAKTTKHLISN